MHQRHQQRLEQSLGLLCIEGKQETFFVTISHQIAIGQDVLMCVADA